MSRVALSALFAAAAFSFAAPEAAIAGCYNCYRPVTTCATCYQEYVAPPQYRSTYDHVMVAPERVIKHHVPAQYGTVYETVVVPRTVVVQPERVVRERVPAQYATVERVEVVSPGRRYWAPSHRTCTNCGW